MEHLRAKGARISYSDPYVPIFPKMREHNFNLKSTKITKNTLKSFDCVLIATDHDDFDYELIRKNARLIVDSRGVYPKSFKNIIKA